MAFVFPETTGLVTPNYVLSGQISAQDPVRVDSRFFCTMTMGRLYARTPEKQTPFSYEPPNPNYGRDTQHRIWGQCNSRSYCWSLLFQNPFVFVVLANPKPNDSITLQQSKHTIIVTHTHRINRFLFADAFETETRRARVGFPKLVRFAGALLRDAAADYTGSRTSARLLSSFRRKPPIRGDRDVGGVACLKICVRLACHLDHRALCFGLGK